MHHPYAEPSLSLHNSWWHFHIVSTLEDELSTDKSIGNNLICNILQVDQNRRSYPYHYIIIHAAVHKKKKKKRPYYSCFVPSSFEAAAAVWHLRCFVILSISPEYWIHLPDRNSFQFFNIPANLQCISDGISDSTVEVRRYMLRATLFYFLILMLAWLS